MRARYTLPIRGTLRIASNEPIKLKEFTFQFEVNAGSGYVHKLIMEVANIPKEHWPIITHIGQDPNANMPRWPFETNRGALRFGAYEAYLVNLESYLGVFGLEAIEFRRLKEEWVADSNDEVVSMEAGFSVERLAPDPVANPLSPINLARCIAASNAPETDTLTLANFRVGQMHFHNGLYVEAIRHLYFCLEHEFAGGAFKKAVVVDNFCKSPELIAVVDGLFFNATHSQFERLRNKYALLKNATTVREFCAFLFDLRGSIQHANQRRPERWHPSYQQRFEDEALCVMHVAEKICFKKAMGKITSVPVIKDNGNSSLPSQ